MTFTDTFETPIEVEFEGKTYKLEKLVGRDYLGWCAELQRAYQERNIPLIPEDAKPLEKTQQKSAIMGREFTPDDCAGPVSTQNGAERVINTAFVRAITGKRWEKYPDDQGVKDALEIADRFLESLPWQDKQALALRLSGLFLQNFFDKWFHVDERKQAKMVEGAQPPNDGAASAANQTLSIGKSAA